MLASILSLGLLGIEGFVVTTEVNLAPGMPAFDIVGLPDAAVRESRERVRAALRNCHFSFPAERLTVNLAPADLKKEGPAFDLPIALGVLACAGAISPDALRETAALGCALTVNNVGLGVGASIAGLGLWLTVLASSACSFLFLYAGNRLGKSWLSAVIGGYAEPISGVMMIALGLFELLG